MTPSTYRYCYIDRSGAVAPLGFTNHALAEHDKFDADKYQLKIYAPCPLPEFDDDRITFHDNNDEPPTTWLYDK